VKQVRADCEKAIDLDKNNPAAYYVLGRTSRQTLREAEIIRWPLGLSWANYDDAKGKLRKGNFAPANVHHVPSMRHARTLKLTSTTRQRSS